MSSSVHGLQGIEPRKGIATSRRALPNPPTMMGCKGLSPVRGLRLVAPLFQAPGTDELQGIEPRKGIATPGGSGSPQ